MVGIASDTFCVEPLPDATGLLAALALVGEAADGLADPEKLAGAEPGAGEVDEPVPALAPQADNAAPAHTMAPAAAVSRSNARRLRTCVVMLKLRLRACRQLIDPAQGIAGDG